MARKHILTIIAAAAFAMPGAATAQKAKPSPTPSPTATAKPFAEMTIDEIFAVIDDDGNGRISRQEMHAFGVGNGIGQMINQKSWKTADKDRNGWISKDELLAFAKSRKR